MRAMSARMAVDELDEPQRGDHLLEPRADLVEVRGEGGGDRGRAKPSSLGATTAPRGKFPSVDDFLRGQRGGLPSRPAPRPGQLDALDDQRELRGLDGDRRQATRRARRSGGNGPSRDAWSTSRIRCGPSTRCARGRIAWKRR